MRTPPVQRTQTEQRRLEEQTEKLVHAFIRRPLVQLYDAADTDEAAGIGSGTLLRAGSGRATVLTARHVLDGVQTAFVRDSEEKPHSICDVLSIAPNIDIALAVVAGDNDAMAGACLDPLLLADASGPILAVGETVTAIGYPSQVRTTVVDLERGVRWHRYGDMIRHTVVLGFDRKAISLEWRDSEIDTPHVFEAAGFPRAGSHRLKKPRGISGGAVWRQDRRHVEIWMPEAVFSLVAVLHEFSNGRQLAVPASLWSSWVRETLARL